MAWTERYVSVAGGGNHDGTTETDAWTLAEAIAAPYAAGQRINVKAGTYANTTTGRTFNIAGTTTAPIWWRGYNATIGDLDADFATAKPAITFTTGLFQVNASYQLFSNLDISGAQTTAAQVRLLTGTNIWMDRCRIECTSANANGRAFSSENTGCGISRSWIKSTSSADVARFTTNTGAMLGCAVVGGANGLAVSGTGIQHVICFNTFIDQGADAIDSSQATRLYILNNSIYSPAGQGIDLNTTIPTFAVIANNIFSECGTYGINNSTGANTGNVIRLHNDFYASGTADENGFGDHPSFSGQTESSSPFTSATDMTIPNTRNAIANGLPGLFENQTYTSYLDIGAVQRVEPVGGGGRPEIRGSNL